MDLVEAGEIVLGEQQPFTQCGVCEGRGRGRTKNVLVVFTRYGLKPLYASHAFLAYSPCKKCGGSGNLLKERYEKACEICGVLTPKFPMPAYSLAEMISTMTSLAGGQVEDLKTLTLGDERLVTYAEDLINMFGQRGIICGFKVEELVRYVTR